MTENKVKSWTDWGDSPNKDYPDAMLVVSELMKQNFLRYREVLSMIILDIVAGYKSALFGVVDSNNNILLAGVALFKEESSKSVSSILRAFFKIQKAKPRSILTEGQKYIAEALKYLSDQNIFRGAHILSPMHILRKASLKFNGSTADRLSVMSSLTTLLDTRDKDEFHETVGLLLSNPVNKSLIEELTNEENKSIFYCCTGKSFVGLTRAGCQKLHKLVRPHFREGAAFCDFFRKSVTLNVEITDNFWKSFNHYEVDTGLCEWDPRIS